MPTDASVVVVVPTYNEIDNLGPIVQAIRLHGVRVLVVDDGSPDGTGQLADELSADDLAVSVLHRFTKDGLGRAYGQAFRELSEDPTVEVMSDGRRLLPRSRRPAAPDRGGSGGRRSGHRESLCPGRVDA